MECFVAGRLTRCWLVAVDGAYFGTTFPHLFFLTYKELEPAPSTLLYVPRVFGYKIHNKSENRRRLAILAKEGADEEKTQQQVRHDCQMKLHSLYFCIYICM